MSFDQAHQHIQKGRALGFREWGQQALLRGEQGRAQPVAQVSAPPRSVELARPSVIGIDLPFDQAFLLEKFDHLAEGDRIDTHAGRKLPLAASRLL
ncbi:hypothetical protein RX328_06860 [Bradyrhizobium sp. sBnM-33]|nr:hypothetical protein [Bradyrhizobium sp. sBnM-33]WOH51983.1 hypothetical protein RX328_06860 [Bradyrhizobium sp. sBnM-33]